MHVCIDMFNIEIHFMFSSNNVIEGAKRKPIAVPAAVILPFFLSIYTVFVTNIAG